MDSGIQQAAEVKRQRKYARNLRQDELSKAGAERALQRLSRALAFERELRGFRVRVFYQGPSNQNAAVEWTLNGKPLKSYQYAAYRIWNIDAHFEDIVADFEQQLASPESVEQGVAG